jgi:hypothetical protein
MTIGIGVLCSTKPRPYTPRPDAAIIIADTMGSTETDSMDELHKCYFDDEAKLYFTCAGRVEMAGELGPMFISNVKGLASRGHGAICEALNIAVHGHRVQHFKWDVMAQRHSPLMTDRPGYIPVFTGYEKDVLEEWRNYDNGTQILVSTFTDDGQSLLYLIGKLYDANSMPVPGLVHLQEFPGHATIGSGGYNAQFWLNYRQQHLGRDLKQSAYHAYEATIMAAKAPTVNANIEIISATAEKSWHLTAEKPEAAGCGVSLSELQQMFKKYGPQDTFPLGHLPKQSAARKLKRGP